MENPKYIKLIDKEWYLIKNDLFPSGYTICQYIDNKFIEQINVFVVGKGRIVKHLIK